GGVPTWLTAVLALAAAVVLAARGVAPEAFWPAAVVLTLSVAAWAIAARFGRATSATARNRVTLWLHTGLLLTLWTVAFALIDSVGQTLYIVAAVRDERVRLYQCIAGAFGAV